MTARRSLLVIGHKHPDTDSICSAIAYACHKRDVFGDAAVPYRAGNLNPQAAFVLSHFGVEIPALLTDLYPKIGDIMVQKEELVTVREVDTLRDARDTMVSRGFSFLPVIDDAGKCSGKITALRLAGLTQEIAEMLQDGNVRFDVRKFVESTGGRIVAPGAGLDFEGKLVVNGVPGSGDLPTTRPVAFVACDDENTIVGAVEAGAKLVVVCGAGGLTGRTTALAVEKGVCLVVSPKDVLATVMALAMARPVTDFVQRDHLTFRHTDLVRDVQKKIAKCNEGGFVVLDDDGKIRGVITRVNFLTQNRFRVVMVDHNEFAQAVDGIEEAEVVEIIDHHRLGNRSTDTPITFVNKVVGATATIIAELYRNRDHRPSPGVAGIMLSAILSDTVILKSPTTTQLDRDACKWLASLAALDVEGFGEKMFAAGSALAGTDPEQIIGRDVKTYTEADRRLSISQLEVVGFKEFHEMKDQLREALEKARSREGCDFSCLMVTDITRQTSLLLCAGEEKVAGAITYSRIEDDLFEMKAVLSRKKQVLPYLLELIRAL